jgi:predicted enzyme related to lactoylglutathione lyase
MSQSSLKLSHISNIMLGVRDLAHSVAFYWDTLGLTVRQQVPGFAFLGGGGVILALSEELAKALPQSGSSVVIVFSVDDVRSPHEELAARKIHFTQEPRNITGNLRAANFDDPDGHHLSIFGPERKG